MHLLLSFTGRDSRNYPYTVHCRLWTPCPVSFVAEARQRLSLRPVRRVEKWPEFHSR